MTSSPIDRINYMLVTNCKEEPSLKISPIHLEKLSERRTEGRTDASRSLLKDMLSVAKLPSYYKCPSQT